jgi:membrane-bound ClpP family serine protease
MNDINLEFLSGLALTAAALAALIYVIYGMFGDRIPDLKNVRHNLAEAYEKYVAREAKPVNDHLLGSLGPVVSHTGDSDCPMRVRINLEFWPARMSTSAGQPVSIGDSIRVKAVDGSVLVVEASDVVAESSDVPG